MSLKIAPNYRAVFFFYICICLPINIFADNDIISTERALNTAIELYRTQRYEEATGILELIRGDESARSYHPEALYWIAQINISQGRFGFAYEQLDVIVVDHASSQRYEDALYHRARLNYYIGNYNRAIQFLEAFRSIFPNSKYVGNSYYWSGLSLVTLGEKQAAADMFQTIIFNYPTSYRVDAAQYQLSLLSAEKKEQDLADILRWSQEEYLELIREVEDSARETDRTIEVFAQETQTPADNELLNEYRRQVERLRLEVDSLRRIEVDKIERGEGNTQQVEERNNRLLELKRQFEETRTEVLNRLEGR